MASRLLNLENYPVFEKPDLDVFSMDPGSSQFHIMLRQMQRDHGMISDAEMALAERIAGPHAKNAQQRILFNPFTGTFRKEGLK